MMCVLKCVHNLEEGEWMEQQEEDGGDGIINDSISGRCGGAEKKRGE
jgi:hypothetical protein